MRKGFTLIELLVVIAIIALLSTLAIVALSGARQKSRDAKRLADVRQVQSALEMYFNDKGRYPDAVPNFGTSLISTTTGATTTLMTKVPKNPTSSQYYPYTVLNSGASYRLTFTIEAPVNNYVAGNYIATPVGISATSTPEGPSFACGTELVQYDGGPWNSTGSSRNQGGYYKTVAIGSQCWLADNLNAGVMVEDSELDCPNYDGQISCQEMEGNGTQKYCYGNSASNCLTYGGLYEWPMALQIYSSDGIISAIASQNSSGFTAANFQISYPHQGICPVGWHLPTVAEFDYLDQTIGESDYHNFGRAFKEYSFGGDGQAGFDIKPSGYREIDGSGFFYLGDNAFLLAIDPQGNSDFLELSLDSSSAAGVESMPRASGVSVRCLKN